MAENCADEVLIAETGGHSSRRHRRGREVKKRGLWPASSRLIVMLAHWITKVRHQWSWRSRSAFKLQASNLTGPSALAEPYNKAERKGNPSDMPRDHADAGSSDGKGQKQKYRMAPPPAVIIRSRITALSCALMSLFDDIVLRSSTSFRSRFFSVPLNYAAPAAEDKIMIAIRILLGSTGASGHASLLRTGPIIGANFDEKFDIASWAPHGVNISTSHLVCLLHFVTSKPLTTSLRDVNPTNPHRDLYALNHDSEDLAFNDADDPTFNKFLRTHDVCACPAACGALPRRGRAVGVGAIYVAMFSEISDRVVLDGVVYAPEQYSSLVERGKSAGKSANGVWLLGVSS
ncbi:hypothetical protein C8R44DRAFT_747445 [Mycena epipterygia]|nr:hypothetical protein C8R44DRAFT_747445 [Mycena epipterygia]